MLSIDTVIAYQGDGKDAFRHPQLTINFQIKNMRPKEEKYLVQHHQLLSLFRTEVHAEFARTVCPWEAEEARDQKSVLAELGEHNVALPVLALRLS